ncbi:MAG: protein translocase subunit SecF [Bacteroidota bacterium]
MRILGKTNINFMATRRSWYIVSAVIILAGLASLFVKGVNYGIDFLGGTELVVRFDQPVDIGEVRSAMTRVGFERAEIKTFGSERDILIRTGSIQTGEGVAVGDILQEGLRESFSGNPFVVQKEDKIGPKIGAELRRDAVYAIVASLIAIWLYIGFRFRFVYGVGAVAALFHDVLLTLGIISICDGVGGLNLEINQNMIAAFLTLVGLSVNDSVVIFDRIRENQKIFKTMNLADLMNKSINEMLSRTIITSGTIFVVLMVLMIFGGEVNRGFAFTLLVGIITGTYSSIYTASAVALDWTLRGKAQGRMVK